MVMSWASGNKTLGAIHTAALPEKQIGLSESVRNQTNFICSQWQNIVDSSPNETFISGDTGICNAEIVSNS